MLRSSPTNIDAEIAVDKSWSKSSRCPHKPTRRASWSASSSRLCFGLAGARQGCGTGGGSDGSLGESDRAHCRAVRFRSQVEEVSEVAHITDQGDITERIVEQFMDDAPAPQVVEEIIGVAQIIPEEDITERIDEQFDEERVQRRIVEQI